MNNQGGDCAPSWSFFFKMAESNMATTGYTENPIFGVYDAILTCNTSHPTNFGVLISFLVAISRLRSIFIFKFSNGWFFVCVFFNISDRLLITFLPLFCSPQSNRCEESFSLDMNQRRHPHE